MGAALTPPPPPPGAVKARERWQQDGQPLRVEPVEIDDDRIPEHLVAFGRVTALEYVSNKGDGVWRRYRHEIPPEANVRLLSDTKPSCWLFMLARTFWAWGGRGIEKP